MTLKQFTKRAERHRERVKREDRRAGEIVAILFNANRDPEKTEGIDWQDVFADWKEPVKQQTEGEMFQTMMALTKATEGLSQ